MIFFATLCRDTLSFIIKLTFVALNRGELNKEQILKSIIASFDEKIY